MARLCVPVTDIFRRNRDQLLPLVDAVSFKQLSDEVYAGKAHFLECPYDIADVGFQAKLSQSGLLEALRSGKYESFACDLGPAWRRYDPIGRSPNGYPRYLPIAGPLREEEYLNQAEENVEFLRDKFSGTIKAEQLGYFPTGAYEVVCDPDFIRRVIRLLGIELLLDVGHMVLSAANLHIPLNEYLDRLPLECVSEVHLSGSGELHGIWEDLHDLPSGQGLSVLAGLCARTPLRYITVEYYKDDRKLVDCYRQMANWIDSTFKA